MNKKKSILIYFDNYPMVASLPVAQRGLLLTALMVYGERLSREEVPLEEVLEGFPMLSPEARLACGFMGANIQRDTQKWLSRRQRGSAGRGRQNPPAPEERARQDMERTRRLMEQLQEGEKQDA